MTSSEKFCLKWHDFQENICKTFKTLREDLDFADVTLACVDGAVVEAHKVVLASSSPVFKNLLKINQHAHPLIYMRGMKSEDLTAILDFMYHGETNINQENLDSFLAIGEELKVHGLAGNNQEIKTENKTQQNYEKKKNAIKRSSQETYHHEVDQSVVETFEQEDHFAANQEKSVSLTNPKISVNIEELDETIKSMMTRGEKITTGSQAGAWTRICVICEKEGLLTNIKDHIEANHIEGISHPCNQCAKTFRSRHLLRHHHISCHKH